MLGLLTNSISAEDKVLSLELLVNSLANVDELEGIVKSRSCPEVLASVHFKRIKSSFGEMRLSFSR